MEDGRGEGRREVTRAGIDHEYKEQAPHPPHVYGLRERFTLSVVAFIERHYFPRLGPFEGVEIDSSFLRGALPLVCFIDVDIVGEDYARSV